MHKINNKLIFSILFSLCVYFLYVPSVSAEGGVGQPCPCSDPISNYCDTDNKCQPKRSDGASCSAAGECAGGFCYGGKCHSEADDGLGTEGEACPCDYLYYCTDSNTCHRKLGDGVPCTSASQCQNGHCVETSSGKSCASQEITDPDDLHLNGCCYSASTTCGAGGCSQYQVCVAGDNPYDGCGTTTYHCGNPTPATACQDAEPKDTDTDGSSLTLNPYAGPKITNFINQVLGPVVKILYYLGLSLGLIFIVYSGYLFMTSEGNPDQVQSAKDHLTSAVAGTLFILLSVAILRVIINQILGGSITI